MRTGWWILGMGIVVWIGAHTRTMATPPLSAALSATGARASGYAVSDWVSVDRPTNLDVVTQRLSRALTLSPRFREREGPDYSAQFWSGSVGGDHLEIVVENVQPGAEYIVVTASALTHGQNFGSTVARLKTALHPYGVVHQDVNLVGHIAGVLTPVKERAAMRHAWAALKGAPVVRETAGMYVSELGFSPLFSDTMGWDGHRVDVEIAIGVNPGHRQTTVYVGTPLVTMWY
jgi:hypothetical protein